MNLNVTLIAQAVTFFAFIWFCAKFVWPPLMRAIETRQKQIADGLAAGEQGKRALELSSVQANEEIVKARARAAEIVAQAEKRASQMIEEAKSSAREEGNREKTAAKAEIEQEVSRAKEALRSQVAALAVSGAEKILRREVDTKVHADLLRAVQAEL
jgi:F-type H+-transporting ATPase subunit b